MDGNKLDKKKYKENMDLVYVNRVDGCPCGETTIHLFKGADSTAEQETRKYILIYLKGTKSQREALKKEKPSLYAYCEQVWQIRRSHMIPDLPPQYAFFLVCCLRHDCTHPLCSNGEVGELPLWFNSGPSISYLPLPIPDPSRPYGN